MNRTAKNARGCDAAFLLPMGEKDRMRGFGRRDFFSESVEA
jgi:hypothetical protein